MSDDLRITIDDLRKRMKAGEDFTVLDVRNPTAWAESDVMIPNARRVPLDDFESHLYEIPKINRSSRIAPDQAKGQAPVWRSNFANAAIRKLGL